MTSNEGLDNDPGKPESISTSEDIRRRRATWQNNEDMIKDAELIALKLPPNATNEQIRETSLRKKAEKFGLPKGTPRADIEAALAKERDFYGDPSLPKLGGVIENIQEDEEKLRRDHIAKLNLP